MQQRLNLKPIPLLHLPLPRQRILSLQPRLRSDEAETVFLKIPFAGVGDGIHRHGSLVILMVRGACAGDVVNGHVGIERFLDVEDVILS